MGTKSETLSRLEKCVTKSKILGQVCVKYKDFKNNNSEIFLQIKKTFDCKKVIVRSSSSLEDGWEQSHAGGFETILNVEINKDNLNNAINRVFASYNVYNDNSQVFVQQMLQGVEYAGVLFTYSLDNSPYYVINYDDMGSTNSVTSGEGADLKNYWVLRAITPKQKNALPKYIQSLLGAINEIESLLNYNLLDIEFAIKDGVVYILQIRPLVKGNGFASFDNQLLNSLESSQKKWLDFQQKLTPFSVMSDWNPAEIIGVKPCELAYSLYKYIITDEIWAIQRDEFGYKKISNTKLLERFSGVPYVNVRKSANSFVPKNVNDKYVNIIIDAYIDRFCNNIKYHDKWEFEVVFTCWSPDITERIKNRYPDFNQGIITALEDGLKDITVNAIKNIDQYFIGLDKMLDDAENIYNSDLSPQQKVKNLLDSSKVGTLKFSHLARCGFIAVDILQYMLRSNQITKQDYDGFLQATLREL